MGKPRKHQSGYTLGVDRLGRPAWRSTRTRGDYPSVAPPAGDDDYMSVGGYTLPKLVGDSWEAASPDIPTDLRCQNLSGLMLSRVNLRTADVRGADLSYAIISSSDVSGADLTQVNGTDAELWGTFFSGAMFARSDFTGLHLQEGSGSHVDFTDTLLTGAAFYEVSIYKSSFAGADARNMTFRRFGGEEIDFTGTDLSGSVFEGGRGMSSCELVDCTFRHADLSNVVLQDTRLESGDFTGANLTGIDFSTVHILRSHSHAARKIIFTDSNVTGAQIAALLEGNPEGSASQLVYRRHTVDDLQRAAGWDDAELIVRLWSGDIETRDNVTQEIVVGQFDRDRHHIPQWELAALPQ